MSRDPTNDPLIRPARTVTVGPDGDMAAVFGPPRPTAGNSGSIGHAASIWVHHGAYMIPGAVDTFVPIEPDAFRLAGTSNMRAVKWIERLGLFITVGALPVVATSPDGLTWTIRVGQSISTSFVNGAEIVDDGTHVFVGVDGLSDGGTQWAGVLSSTDGITWTKSLASIFTTEPTSFLSSTLTGDGAVFVMASVTFGGGGTWPVNIVRYDLATDAWITVAGWGSANGSPWWTIGFQPQAINAMFEDSTNGLVTAGWMHDIAFTSAEETNANVVGMTVATTSDGGVTWVPAGGVGGGEIGTPIPGPIVPVQLDAHIYGLHYDGSISSFFDLYVLCIAGWQTALPGAETLYWSTSMAGPWTPITVPGYPGGGFGPFIASSNWYGTRMTTATPDELLGVNGVFLTFGGYGIMNTQYQYFDTFPFFTPLEDSYIPSLAPPMYALVDVVFGMPGSLSALNMDTTAYGAFVGIVSDAAYSTTLDRWVFVGDGEYTLSPRTGTKPVRSTGVLIAGDTTARGSTHNRERAVTKDPAGQTVTAGPSRIIY